MVIVSGVIVLHYEGDILSDIRDEARFTIPKGKV
jgi:hypothetical protein